MREYAGNVRTTSLFTSKSKRPQLRWRELLEIKSNGVILVTPGGMVNVSCGTERENGSINYGIRFTAIDDQWHYPGHQPIHTDVGANCIRGLCAPLRAGLARTGLANPATGPNTATVALATFVAFKAVGSATCQQRSRRGAFEEQLTGIGCTHSRGWLNQVKEHGRTGRDCSAA